MEFNALTCISPIDGRYHSKTEKLRDYFSEFGLIKYRVFVEIEYFIALTQEQIIPPSISYIALREVHEKFTLEDAQKIKQLEKTTNHDVKAVEYFLKEKFRELGVEDGIEFIHFGLTSQDINNTAIPLSLKAALEEVIYPNLEILLDQLHELSVRWSKVPMLARTHGQPASPTRLGKEIHVFEERLRLQLQEAKRIPHAAKFGGATGNFNAHHVAYPNVDWKSFANQFVAGLGLQRSQTTTQIEHYDFMAALFDALKRINTILIDLNRDLWMYISM
ncbi:MAG: adenylosuccinate lyase, partial [Flavobacteriia bacterium]|nr:adenylosuccinate lyase [Flavobacteriia bacterium]